MNICDSLISALPCCLTFLCCENLTKCLILSDIKALPNAVLRPINHTRHYTNPVLLCTPLFDWQNDMSRIERIFNLCIRKTRWWFFFCLHRPHSENFIAATAFHSSWQKIRCNIKMQPSDRQVPFNYLVIQSPEDTSVGKPSAFPRRDRKKISHIEFVFCIEASIKTPFSFVTMLLTLSESFCWLFCSFCQSVFLLRKVHFSTAL